MVFYWVPKCRKSENSDSIICGSLFLFTFISRCLYINEVTQQRIQNQAKNSVTNKILFISNVIVEEVCASNCHYRHYGEDYVPQNLDWTLQNLLCL